MMIIVNLHDAEYMYFSYNQKCRHLTFYNLNYSLTSKEFLIKNYATKTAAAYVDNSNFQFLPI